MIISRTGVEGCGIVPIDQDKIGRQRRLITLVTECLESLQNEVERINMFAGCEVREVRERRYDSRVGWNLGDELIFSIAFRSVPKIGNALADHFACGTDESLAGQAGEEHAKNARLSANRTREEWRG